MSDFLIGVAGGLGFAGLMYLMAWLKERKRRIAIEHIQEKLLNEMIEDQKRQLAARRQQLTALIEASNFTRLKAMQVTSPDLVWSMALEIITSCDGYISPDEVFARIESSLAKDSIQRPN